jgi:hypothetical protein
MSESRFDSNLTAAPLFGFFPGKIAAMNSQDLNKLDDVVPAACIHQKGLLGSTT